MKVRLIFLAAGNSRRFGSNKLLHPLKGKPMYSYGLEVMKSLLKEDHDLELCVVTRFEDIHNEVDELAKLPGMEGRVHAVDSPDSVNGISYSIRAGLLGGDTGEVENIENKEQLEIMKQVNCDEQGSYVVNYEDQVKNEKFITNKKTLENDNEADYYLFLVADQPFIRKETIERLISETLKQKSIAGCITWNGELGNPVIFSNDLKADLLNLQGDKGGKSVLKKYIDQICLVSANSEEEVIDCDYVSELDKVGKKS